MKNEIDLTEQIRATWLKKPPVLDAAAKVRKLLQPQQCMLLWLLQQKNLTPANLALRQWIVNWLKDEHNLQDTPLTDDEWYRLFQLYWSRRKST